MGWEGWCRRARRDRQRTFRWSRTDPEEARPRFSPAWPTKIAFGGLPFARNCFRTFLHLPSAWEARGAAGALTGIHAGIWVITVITNDQDGAAWSIFNSRCVPHANIAVISWRVLSWVRCKAERWNSQESTGGVHGKRRRPLRSG